MDRSLKKNIGKNYLFLSLIYIDFTRALWMIWLYLQGFSLLQLGFLEGIFHLTSFLMEIPTGLVADIYGRKISRMLGRILFTASLLILYFGGSFWIQAFGFVLTAIGYNLESGAGEALLYDSLKEIGQENHYKKIGGFNNGIIEISMIIGTLLGGFLATRLGYHWVFIPSILFCILSLFIASSMQEPTLAREEQKKLQALSPLKAMIHQTKESILVVKKQPRIAFLILFVELIAMFGTTTYFYLQTWWKSQGWTELRIGIFLALSGLFSILGGLTAERTERKIGERGMLTVLPVLMVLLLWGIGFTGLDWIAYSLTGWVMGNLYVVIQDYLNRMIPSERRASVLSFQSMTFSLFMIVFFPVVGWIGDSLNLQSAFRIMALVSTVLLVPYLWVYHRKKETPYFIS